MATQERDPNEIVLAKRKAGWGPVSTDFRTLRDRMPEWQPSLKLIEQGSRAMIEEGDVIPMTYEEVMGRSDFELATEVKSTEEKVK